MFIGPMASGKTSLGRQVAKELGIAFVDSDAIFVRAHGPITQFFEDHGEAAFRVIEAEIIAAELAKPVTRIIALGGGAVLSDATRMLLQQHPVVLLMTTQEAVLRTANIARRPLLRDDPSAWGRILEARRHLYEEVADITYRTDRASKAQLARKVAIWARSRRSIPPVARAGGQTEPGRQQRQAPPQPRQRPQRGQRQTNQHDQERQQPPTQETS